MEDRFTLVLGASPEPTRYAHMAVDRLVANGHHVLAVGKRSGNIGTVPIQREVSDGVLVDTVSLYLNPRHQAEWYGRLLALRPRRMIFNPGTENPELEKLAANAGVEILRACTLVMLAAGTY